MARDAAKVAMVTGCSSGFGSMIATELARKGFTVYATMRDVGGRNKEKKAELEATVPKGDVLHVLECDVLDGRSVQAAVDEIMAKEGRIDVLVNNAGYGLYGPIETGGDEAIRKVFDTNVLGYMRTIKAVLPGMRARRGGHVINVGSVMGALGLPHCGLYSMTKFAVRGMSEALLGEGYLFNVKVTLVAPMGYNTDFLHRSLQLTVPVEDSGEYKVSYNDIVENIDNFGKNTGDPRNVALAVARVAGKRSPPFLVPVGKLARSSLLFIKLFPTLRLQKVMAKVFGFTNLFTRPA